jgi:hypothetical protein
MKYFFVVSGGVGRFETKDISSIGPFVRTMYPNHTIIECGPIS